MRSVHHPRHRPAAADPRWPALAAHLAGLREKGRHAVRVVDADCGSGTLLLHAVRHARALGFTAIEARGLDGSPALIARARVAARRLADPAIGITVEVADRATALCSEHDLPADLLLWHGSRADDAPGLAAIVARAARVVIDDAATMALAA